MHNKLATNTPVVTSDTAVFAVIGAPVGHSKSPLMHNAAFAACGWNGVYTAFHVEPEQLKNAIAGMRAFGIRGINVTIPHKEHVMAYLDEIDESARMIGAVNTIVNDKGKLIGYNTDGPGYVRSLKEETEVQLTGATVLIIGAGGAARGLAFGLLREGVKHIYIANRTIERAERIAQDLQSMGSIEAVGLVDRLPQTGGARVDLVINTTSLGMHPYPDEMPLQASYLKPHMIVSDIIYNPLETKLLAEARALGAVTHSGLGMFIYQGVIAFELWTGISAPVSVMRDAVMRAMSES
ncbi:shikimate dehydrogenase [Paenibacillus marinisediminis]